VPCQTLPGLRPTGSKRARVAGCASGLGGAAEQVGAHTDVHIPDLPAGAVAEEHGDVVRPELVSGRGESHPPALVEPDVNLAIHPAPITQPSRLCELPVDEQFRVGSFDPLKELHGPTAASA